MSKMSELEYETRMAAEPKFAQTYCSQCGQNLGPGDSGVSHCRDHMREDALVRLSNTHQKLGAELGEVRKKIGEQLGEQELKLRNFELKANVTSKFLEWHAEVVKLAVLAEREACAVVCAERAASATLDSYEQCEAEACAAAIRERGNT